VATAIREAPGLGSGHGPLSHFVKPALLPHLCVSREPGLAPFRSSPQIDLVPDTKSFDSSHTERVSRSRGNP
jgi:hypothetical protein